MIACTPDSAGAADVREASSHFKLPSHLLCKIGQLELQVSDMSLTLTHVVFGVVRRNWHGIDKLLKCCRY